MLGRVEITGREHVPGNGSYIVAINHVSLYEPPFIAAFWHEPLETLGAAEVWQKKGQRTLARLYGGIPVHRGEFDRSAIKMVLSALSSGRPLLIAPEGGRTHTPGMRKAMPGVAYLVDKARVPVIPTGIVGTTEDYFSNAIRGKRPKLEMRIGQPVMLPPITGRGEARRQALQANADLVMEKIADLLPEEYRGVYAR